ncbi:LLM class flavin-dependent oxidoreductase [Actinomadura sp. HBU206391]|uniref:LLM class flavin-dependent oxidoreductase n=1 Tax=Actinomadura sp. HBU206391 TaxID=2731692 RepID=UPI0016500C9B|nr:LLM class flavin-dependent oxidoreductase [Actinomadura sp. HBU206391]MBC6458037.1 LLM class flavin-dependent oxidoreductase [Actinomadura sp. HBU206391]
MRFGLFLPAGQFSGERHGDALARTVEAAAAAELAGFDDVWVAEHHFMSYGVCPSAVTLAGYLLGATSRIEVGTAVSVLSNQHPVALAEQAALLSLVSGGRFRLGVGRGGPWVDLEVFGTGLERFEEGFAESLDLLLTWLSSERVSWPGRRFRFREVPVVPRPDPAPPVVVACTSPGTEALAAARGLPMLLGMHVGDAEKAAAIARYADLGGPAPHIATGVAHVADTREEAVSAVRRELPRWLGPGLAGYVPVDGRPTRPRDPDEYARLLCELHPVGGPDDCVEALTATAATTGIEHVILLVDCTGSRERTLENIARLGAEVLPKVRDTDVHGPKARDRPCP